MVWFSTLDLRTNYKNEEQEALVSENENYFQQIQFTLLREKKPYLSLNATEMISFSISKKSTFLNPMGVFFSETLKPINYSADRGLIYQEKDIFFLDGFVRLKTDESEFLSDYGEYRMRKDEVYVRGNVDSKSIMKTSQDAIVIKSNEAFLWPEKKLAKYLGNTHGKIIKKHSYEEGLEFKANELIASQVDQKVDMLGDVWMKKQDSTATSRKGEIFLENYNKKLKYFVLYDDVKVLEKLRFKDKNGVQVTAERRGFGERLDGMMSENKFVLTGSPKVVQGTDVIRGNVIVLREDNDVVEVDDANSNFNIKD